MMPMQNSLAARLSGMGMQPPGPAQVGPAAPVSPQGMPMQNTLARPMPMRPGMTAPGAGGPPMSGPVGVQMQPQVQAQPQMQAQQPMQNNLRRMMAY